MRLNRFILSFAFFLLFFSSCDKEQKAPINVDSHTSNRHKDIIDYYIAIINSGQDVVFLLEDDVQVVNPDRTWLIQHFQNPELSSERTNTDIFWFEFKLNPPNTSGSICVNSVTLKMLNTSGVQKFQIVKTGSVELCPGPLYVSSTSEPKYLQCYKAPRITISAVSPNQDGTIYAKVYRDNSVSMETCFITTSAYGTGVAYHGNATLIVGSDTNWCDCD